ncbi:MAG TPA: LCP family protein [Solirubrobacteraceae bacterium]|nr:LCP family protein [Solirubrobacteraceae bacterium]
MSRTLRRMIGASVLIVALTCVALSTAAIETVGTVADLIGKGVFVKSSELRPVGADSPTTFLILGSDQRDKGAIDYINFGHSDTILLIHLDPSTGLWSEMSIPRDFYVHWKWQGNTYSSKINYAFSVGGVKASLHVVTGLLHIPINYVVDIDFTAFDKIVDKLGCVYVDVDHLYYNPPGTGYASINVRPGYQRLCGQHALDYVRYRHDDSTFARDAREQGFLRDAKQQLGLSGLLGHASDIVNALASDITSNLPRSSAALAGLLLTVVDSVSGPVNQIQFPNNPLVLPDGEEDQTATPREIQTVVAKFEQPSVAPPQVAGIVAAARRAARHRHAHGASGSSFVPTAPHLIATDSNVATQAQTLSPNVSFPILVPSLSLNTATLAQSSYEPFSHYEIRDPQGHAHFGYRIFFSTGNVASYYGIEGMNWTNPPLFDHADHLRVNGVNYLYVNTGGKVQDVGWIAHGALYWISNTIFQDLSNAQMFAIAESAGG